MKPVIELTIQIIHSSDGKHHYLTAKVIELDEATANYLSGKSLLVTTLDEILPSLDCYR